MDILSNFAENLNDLLIENSLNIKTFSIKLDYFECSIDYLLGLEETNDLKFSHTPPFDKTFTKLLKDKNLTRYQLNKHTKIANSRINDWCNGRRLPSIDNLIILATYFDYSLDLLLGRQ